MKKRNWLLTGFLVIILLFMVYNVYFPLVLVVESESGAVLSLPTRHADSFYLVFVHSVHRTPVFEYFRIIGAGSVLLEATEFESYGVGMPSLPSEGVFEQQGTRFRLSQLNRPFGDIPLRVGPEAQLTLGHGGVEYPVYKWLPAGSLVRVRVVDNQLWTLYNRFQFNK